MSELANKVDDAPAATQSQLAMWIAGGVVVLMVAGTVALWAHLGTAVFFEIVRSGFVACFG